MVQGVTLLSVITDLNCKITHAIGKNAPNAGIVAACDLKNNAKGLPGVGKTGPANPSTDPEPNSANYYSVREFEVYGNAVGAKGSAGDLGFQGPQGDQGPQGPVTPNLVLGRNTSASSTFIDSSSSNAVDGTINTSWLSGANSTPEWLQIDLGATYTVREVKLFWAGGDYATGYRIQVSDDPTFTTDINTIYTTTSGSGGIEDLTLLEGSGQYIRVNMTTHPNASVALAEVQVYGYPTSAAVGW